MTDPAWKWRGRVYWEDTDAGGVVYHARYLHFLERARSDWLRELGFGQVEMRESGGCIFAVTWMQLDFIKPARLEDELEVSVSVQGLGRASLDFEQQLHRRGGDLLLTARVRAACLEAAGLRPVRIPERLYRTLQPLAGPGSGAASARRN